jgi:hypothetical protein
MYLYAVKDQVWGYPATHSEADEEIRRQARSSGQEIQWDYSIGGDYVPRDCGFRQLRSLLFSILARGMVGKERGDIKMNLLGRHAGVK